MGAQRTNGVYGALIIKERLNKDEENKTRPVDVIMSIGDWHHFSSEEVFLNYVFLSLKKYSESFVFVCYITLLSFGVFIVFTRLHCYSENRVIKKEALVKTNLGTPSYKLILKNLIIFLISK